MSEQFKRILLGVLLILAGGVFLLQQFLHIPIGSLFIALLFIAAGAVFLFMLLKNRERWWVVIPGFTLIGIGLLIGADRIFPGMDGGIGGMIFLGSIAVSFLVVYLLKPDQWWPIIPAGVLATLALVAGIQVGGMAKGGIFFLGLGATFAVLGLLPVGKKEKWPWIPAAILLVFGFLLLAGSGVLLHSIAGWVWALILIAVGAFFILWSILKKI